MMRVHFVKKARKDVSEEIHAGDSYYWWKFRRGGKRVSKTPPKRSQLTMSGFLGSLYDLEDDFIAKLSADEFLEEAMQEISSTLQDMADECQSSLDNMPEGLQQGDTGQLLQERIDGCSSASQEFESIQFDDKEDDEKEEDYWERKLEEVQSISIDI